MLIFIMKKEEIKKRLGCIESGEDERDVAFAFLSIKKIKVPDSFSLKEQFLDIRFQDDVPACTAFASSSIIEGLKKIAYYISPRDIYCRRSNTSPGMSLRDACDLLKNEGSCREICFPFVPNNAIFCTEKPCANVEVQRSNHRITSYHRVYTSIKSVLWQEKTPVLVAIPIYENWQHMKNGVVPMPDGLAYIGLHAVVISGWKKINDKTYYEFRNSWDSEWGDNGYGYLPLAYPVHEAWVMKKKEETNGEEKIKVKSWQIGKKNLFGANVTFTIHSTIKCRVSLLVNGKKSGISKRIREGANSIHFNIHFELNTETDIKLDFMTGSFFNGMMIATWEGILKVAADITTK